MMLQYLLTDGREHNLCRDIVSRFERKTKVLAGCGVHLHELSRDEA
jgi:hypothetical protein